jgi:DNA invertase Pin-like site-specific DNA recombinase
LLTGTKQDRPTLNRIIDELKTGDVEQIECKGTHIRSLRENWLDTTTPQEKLMFTIFAGLSQFERDLISERTKEGLKAAKARGRIGGRPSKRKEKSLFVHTLYKSGMNIVEIVR